jgi:hypothetical protein
MRIISAKFMCDFMAIIACRDEIKNGGIESCFMSHTLPFWTPT